MSSEQQLLFQTDPKRFWEIVHDDDPDARVTEFKTLDELLLCEVVRYGVFNRQEMIGPLANLYRGPVMQMPEEQRFAIFRHVAGFVEHSSIVSRTRSYRSLLRTTRDESFQQLSLIMSRSECRPTAIQ
jgi:hypothetical protein